MHDDSLNGSECVKLAYQMTLEEKPITSRGLHQVGYVPSAVTWSATHDVRTPCIVCIATLPRVAAVVTDVHVHEALEMEESTKIAEETSAQPRSRCAFDWKKGTRWDASQSIHIKQPTIPFQGTTHMLLVICSWRTVTSSESVLSRFGDNCGMLPSAETPTVKHVPFSDEDVGVKITDASTFVCTAVVDDDDAWDEFGE